MIAASISSSGCVAAGEGAQILAGGEILAIDDSADFDPVDGVPGAERQPVIVAGAAEETVGCHFGRAIAAPRRQLAVGELFDQFCVEQVDTGLVLRDFDLLADAGAVALD